MTFVSARSSRRLPSKERRPKAGYEPAIVPVAVVADEIRFMIGRLELPHYLNARRPVKMEATVARISSVDPLITLPPKAVETQNADRISLRNTAISFYLGKRDYLRGSNNARSNVIPWRPFVFWRPQLVQTLIASLTKSAPFT